MPTAHAAMALPMTLPYMYHLRQMMCLLPLLQCNMDKDCALPPDEADTKEMAVDERDLIVGNVYRKCAALAGAGQALLISDMPAVLSTGVN